MPNSVDHFPRSSPRRPRLLMLAYACCPGRGSEEGTGWNRALTAARYCDTWVICEEELHRPAIEGYLRNQGPVLGLEFVFVPRRAWEIALGRLPGWYYFTYHRWHRRAFQAAQRLHARIDFDLAHMVTFNGFREPSFLWKLGVPFVWGPVGGTQNYPWRFLRDAGAKTALIEAGRGILNRLQFRYSPRVRRAARSAAVVLAANSTAQQDLARVHGVRSTLLSDTGVSEVTSPCAKEFADSSDRPMRILWSGLLISRKALELLIRALAQLPVDLRYELRVLGDGPQRLRWQRLSERLGIAQKIRWLGRLSHAQALAEHGEADVFVFTSLRDTTGAVLHEALAAGLPVVALDHQGARDIVTPEAGIKVPVTTPTEVVAGLAQAISTLARDESLRRCLSAGARRRAAASTWNSQQQTIFEVYRDVLKGSDSEFLWSSRDGNDVPLAQATECLESSEPVASPVR